MYFLSILILNQFVLISGGSHILDVDQNLVEPKSRNSFYTDRLVINYDARDYPNQVATQNPQPPSQQTQPPVILPYYKLEDTLENKVGVYSIILTNGSYMDKNKRRNCIQVLVNYKDSEGKNSKLSFCLLISEWDAYLYFYLNCEPATKVVHSLEGKVYRFYTKRFLYSGDKQSSQDLIIVHQLIITQDSIQFKVENSSVERVPPELMAKQKKRGYGLHPHQVYIVPKTDLVNYRMVSILEQNDPTKNSPSNYYQLEFKFGGNKRYYIINDPQPTALSAFLDKMLKRDETPVMLDVGVQAHGSANSRMGKVRARNHAQQVHLGPEILINTPNFPTLSSVQLDPDDE
jgi:hypothetical protein